VKESELLQQAYGHYFDFVIVNNDIEDTIRTVNKQNSFLFFIFDNYLFLISYNMLLNVSVYNLNGYLSVGCIDFE